MELTHPRVCSCAWLAAAHGVQLRMAACADWHPPCRAFSGALLRTRLLANAPPLLPLPCNPAQCRRNPALPLAEKPWHPLTFRNMARVYEKEQVCECPVVHTRVSCGIRCSFQCSAL